MYSMHLYIQHMVYNFIIGDYEHTCHAYKYAVWLAKKYEHVYVLNLIKMY